MIHFVKGAKGVIINLNSQNPNVTMEMIEARPEKPWDWSWISQNPNITMEETKCIRKE